MGKSTDIQSHTDKYQLLGVLDPDTNEIKPLKLGDATVSGLAVQLYIWDTDTTAWVKMQQPTIEAGDLYVAVDDLEQYTLDQLLQYQMANYDTDSDPQYVGYLDKDGNYYIKKITNSTGVVEYTKGTSGYAAAWTNRASESYDTFDATF
jgi:hypothetical protein